MSLPALYIPELPLEPPEADERPYTHCDICGRAIYGGEGYYPFGTENWCETCVDNVRAEAPYPD